MNDLLRTGEFSLLCGTTKETLRHYENIGLLAPSFIASNGYKYYAPSQIVDYMVISSLKEAGCSLAEIKQFVLSSDTSSMRSIFAEKVIQIEEKKKLLDKKKRVLEDVLVRIDEVGLLEKRGESGSWRIKELNEAFYLETPLPIHGEDSHTIFEAVAEHEAYCNDRGVGFGIEWPKTYRLARDKFETGSYSEGLSLCTRISERIDADRLAVRPAGRYLQYLRQVPLSTPSDSNESTSNSIYKMFDELKQHLEKNDLHAEGDVFSTEAAQSKFGDEEFLAIQTSIKLLP